MVCRSNQNEVRPHFSPHWTGSYLPRKHLLNFCVSFSIIHIQGLHKKLHNASTYLKQNRIGFRKKIPFLPLQQSRSIRPRLWLNCVCISQPIYPQEVRHYPESSTPASILAKWTHRRHIKILSYRRKLPAQPKHPNLYRVFSSTSLVDLRNIADQLPQTYNSSSE